jgi:hypothetical protein
MQLQGYEGPETQLVEFFNETLIKLEFKTGLAQGVVSQDGPF